MFIGVLGVNHKSADLSLREQLAKVCARRFSPGMSLHSHHFFVLLSTCNRTEIYFSSADLAATHSYLLRVLRYDIEEEFEHKLYSYFGFDCFSHLAKVTCGLDSAILAETEIQGQVKAAYEATKERSLLSKELHFLFQKCLKIGKEIRTKRLLAGQSSSLEEAVLQVAANHSLEGKVLFIGASDINLKVFCHFLNKGWNKLSFCNRTDKRLESLKLPVHMLPWENKREWVEYDIVIVGTKCPHYLIHAKECISSKKQLLIDLSVPRNLDPRLEVFDHITLFNVDQINKIVQQKRDVKFLEVALADQDVIQAVQAQMNFFRHKEEARKIRGLHTPLILHGA